MLTLLAIETSTSLASVALLRNGEIHTRESQGVHTHSQVILPMVQELLVEAGATLAQCDAIAFGAGPGSFTGVRTACGIAQGLGYGGNLPVVPVVTLEAMAEACRELNGANDVLTVMDAAMGEVYWARYRYLGQAMGGWQPVVEPRLSSPADVYAQGDGQTDVLANTLACGNGLATYATAFEGRIFVQTALANILPHARQIARLGAEAFSQGKAVRVHDAQPFYLRNKVAYTTAERAELAAQQLTKVCG
ncbi:MAG: tRNA (adenosine(37)-N6)-threonylcarbamoyltransferase complex dimerization subunit type 1 TsaB [Oxalobacter sp.]|nr:MAG: tRNA (adenosine(37)-N6)-threonylcarbamoyltransferase complex dimerization subunit type 1 TsaB [Oxalobacter sp.]